MWCTVWVLPTTEGCTKNYWMQWKQLSSCPGIHSFILSLISPTSSSTALFPYFLLPPILCPSEPVIHFSLTTQHESFQDLWWRLSTNSELTVINFVISCGTIFHFATANVALTALKGQRLRPTEISVSGRSRRQWDFVAEMKASPSTRTEYGRHMHMIWQHASKKWTQKGDVGNALKPSDAGFYLAEDLILFVYSNHGNFHETPSDETPLTIYIN